MTITRTQEIASTSAGAFGTGAYTSASFTPENNCRLVVICWAIQEADGGMRGTDLVVSDSLSGTWTEITATTASPSWSYGIRAWSRSIATAAAMTVSVDTDASNFDMEFYRLEIHSFTTDVGGATVEIGGTAIGSDADGDGAASVTLSATPATSSICLGACLTGLGSSSGTITSGSGFTQVNEAVMTSWAVCELETRTSSTSTTVDWVDVLATGTGFGGATLLAFELAEVGGGGGGTVNDRTVTDLAVVTDGFLDPIVRTRFASETFSLGDSSIRSVIRGRTSAEAITLTDSTGTFRVTLVTVSDTVDLTDQLLRQMFRTKLMSESITVTDEMLRQLLLTRVTSDTIILIDQTIGGTEQAGQINTVTISDVISLIDEALRTVHRNRLSQDTASVTDQTIRGVERTRIQQDAATLQDTFQKNVSITREVTDSVICDDALVKIRHRTVVVEDLASLSDQTIKSIIQALLYDVRVVVGIERSIVIGKQSDIKLGAYN